MSVDVLAIGAHPDDADLGVGGLLLKLAAQGQRTAILDLTQGESGTRGTVVERQQEAENAAQLLQLTQRDNAGLPDGALADTLEQRTVVADCIRRLQPKMLLLPMVPDRHPDHEAAHHLCKSANFFAGVAGLKTAHASYRAAQTYFYHPYHQGKEQPTHIVDITAHFEEKLTALGAYKSQFYNKDYDGPETLVASKAFWNDITTRASYWGQRIGVAYGEPVFAAGPEPFIWPIPGA